MTSFEKLFRQADKYAGHNQARPPPVKDDSGRVESIYGEGGTKFRSEIEGQDIESLRSLLHHVAVTSESDVVLVGRRTKSVKRRKADEESLPKLLEDWEDDVRQLWSGSTNRQESGLEHLPAAKRLIGPISLSQSFDLSIVDLDNDHDPNDYVIPNRYEDTNAVSVSDHDQAAGSDRNQSEVLRRNAIFKRFGHFFPAETNQGAVPTSVSVPASEGSGTTSASAATTAPNTVTSAAPPVTDIMQIRAGTVTAERAAAVGMSRHELIALNRMQKAERLKGSSQYFDPTLSLQDNRGGTRTNVTELSATSFISYHTRLVATLTHAPIATSHRNTKPDLSDQELLHFHRPRLSVKERHRPWSINLHMKTKSAPSSRSSSSHRHSSGKSLVSTVHPGMQTLSLTSSNNAEPPFTFVLIEYAQEHPALHSNYGMASLFVNFYRPTTKKTTLAQLTMNGNEAGSKTGDEDDEKSDSPSLKRLGELLVAHKLRLPRHVTQLWQLSHDPVKRTKFSRDAAVPRLVLGQTVVLNADDESPFLGWDETETLQPALVNRLCRVPLFPQQVRPTDFLLLRTKSSGSGLVFMLREIPFIYVAGQPEPLRVVPRPPITNHGILPAQRLFLALATARVLEVNVQGITLAEVEQAVLRYSRTAPHREAQRQYVRDLATRIIGRYRAKDAEVLVMREEVLQGANIVDDSREQREALVKAILEGTAHPSAYHPERLVRLFEPEDVCCFEASQAAEERLRRHQSLAQTCDLGFLQHFLHFFVRVKSQWNEQMKRLGSSRSLLKDQLEKRVARLDRALRVARHIYDRLVYTPWTTTEAFVSCVLQPQGVTIPPGILGNSTVGDRNHAIMTVGNVSLFPYHSANPAQPKVLDVQGSGDPSGRGEAFAHKRFLNTVVAFQREAKQTGKGKSSRKDASTEPKGLEGTDKDLRRLTKVEAIAMCIQIGVPREKAIAMPRWDRIHVIREFVKQLDKEGRTNTAWSKYLRDEKASSGGGFGSRRLQQQRRLTGYSELGAYQTMDQYRAICRKIWQQQQRSLSSEDWQKTRAEPLSLEGQRLQRRKQRREERQFLEEAVAHQQQGAQKKARRRNKTDEGDTARDGDSSSGSEDLSDDEENTKNDKQKMDVQSSDDDDDDAMEIAQALKKRVAVAQVVVTTGTSGTSSSSTAKSASSTTPNAKRRRKGSQGGDADAEVQELKSLTTMLDQGSTAATAISSVPEPPLPIAMNNAVAAPAPIPMYFPRPSRVVRRVVRSYDCEGKETVTVSFLVSAQEVKRVEALQLRKQNEREQRRLNPAIMEQEVARKLLVLQTLGQVQSSRSGGRGHDDEDDYYEETVTGDVVLHLGKVQERAEMQQLRGMGLAPAKGKGGGGKSGRSGRASQANERSDFVIHEADVAAMRTASRRHKTAPELVQSRLPHVTFAAHLEKEIMTLWNYVWSAEFKYPVNETLFPNYRSLVPEPISLSDIREKNAQYQYSTIQELLDDVEKMARNAERFNGPTHIVAKNGRKLYDTLQKNLTHNRNILGANHDIYAHLEQQIHRQRVAWRLQHNHK